MFNYKLVFGDGHIYHNPLIANVKIKIWRIFISSCPYVYLISHFCTKHPCILDNLIFLEKCTLYAIFKKIVKMNVAHVVEHIVWYWMNFKRADDMPCLPWVLKPIFIKITIKIHIEFPMTKIVQIQYFPYLNLLVEGIQPILRAHPSSPLRNFL
jgi:hypothetical protein